MEAKKVWMNGQFVDWNDAKIHCMSHVIHYGSGIFEGIRMYERDDKSSVIFRLGEHLERLLLSSKIYYMEPKYSLEQLHKAVLETVRVNELKSAYIRPLVYRGLGNLRINPEECPVECLIGAWEWKQYFTLNFQDGAHFKISTWNRPAPNSLPVLAKASGNYLNSQLIEMEARRDNYIGGIALDHQGYVAEASVLNTFVVKDGVLITPSIYQSILSGITRDSVIQIAKQKQIPIVERPIAREELYIADELFVVGTAAELVAVNQVDHITIGNGKKGKITSEIYETYYNLIQGKEEDQFNWVTVV